MANLANVAAILKALANVASQGKYTIDPEGARNMNALFDVVAKTINELEAEINEERDAAENNDAANAGVEDDE